MISREPTQRFVTSIQCVRSCPAPSCAKHVPRMSAHANSFQLVLISVSWHEKCRTMERGRNLNGIYESHKTSASNHSQDFALISAVFVQQVT